MSRIDNLKQQHKDLNITLIDILSEIDPTNSNKYLPFLIKMLKANFSTNGDIVRHLLGRDNIIQLIKFEEHVKSNRIKNNDIGIYNSFKQIADEVKVADEIVRQKEMEKQTKKLHDDDEWLVLIPLSFEASKIYGANTKWCVTQERYWNQYKTDYKIIYIINKKTNTKWAISVHHTLDKIEGWRADDEEINPFLIPIPFQLMGMITEEIRKRETIEDLGEIKSNVLYYKSDRMSNIPTEVLYNGYQQEDDYRTIGRSVNSDLNIEHIRRIMERLQ